MGTIEQALARATARLPGEVAGPMIAALEEGSFRIGAGRFESELAVCPIVAAAKLIGIWVKGTPAAGGPAWGTEEAMSIAVEDFVGWFDLCAEESGLGVALSVVRMTLASSLRPVASC